MCVYACMYVFMYVCMYVCIGLKGSSSSWSMKTAKATAESEALLAMAKSNCVYVCMYVFMYVYTHTYILKTHTHTY